MGFELGRKSMLARNPAAPPLDYANDPDFDLGLDEYGIDPKMSRTGIAISAATLVGLAVGAFFVGRAVLDRIDPPKRWKRRR
jgi:hypothetical protein